MSFFSQLFSFIIPDMNSWRISMTAFVYTESAYWAYDEKKTIAKKKRGMERISEKWYGIRMKREIQNRGGEKECRERTNVQLK